jgi:hypothetical protein
MRLTQQQAVLVQLGLFAKALLIMVPKRMDYSGEADPYGNLRMSQFAGVESWRGTLIRRMDKISRRIHMMEHKGQARVKDESFLDTHADDLNYGCIEAGLEIEELESQDMLRELTSLARSLPAIVQEMLAVASRQGPANDDSTEADATTRTEEPTDYPVVEGAGNRGE